MWACGLINTGVFGERRHAIDRTGAHTCRERLERLRYLLRFKSTQLSLIPTASQPSSPSWLRPLTSSNAALRSIRSALTTWYSHFCRACAEAEGDCRWPIMKAPKNISANKTTLTSRCDVMVSYLPSGLQTLGRCPRVQDFANHMWKTNQDGSA